MDVPELKPNEGGDVVVLIVVRIIVAGKALIIIIGMMMIQIMIRESHGEKNCCLE